MAAWKQKQWKYKNCAPKLPKKEEWLTGISASRLMQTAGNYIQASSKYIAFNVDGHGGSCLGIMPLESRDKSGVNVPLLHAHADFVSDLAFSPHDDCLLVTCSFDNFVKLWRLPSVPAHVAPTTPSATFPELPRRGDAVLWNPLVQHFLAVCSGGLLRLYDASSTEKLFDYDTHDDVIQGIAWSLEGTTVASTCKDKKIRVFDPRANSSNAVQTADGHSGVKDSRVAYVGDGRLITTGFDTQRSREVNVYDLRNFTSALNTVNIDNSNGTLMPFFDRDTEMLYLVGKGDNNVRFMECSSKAPYVVEAGCDYLEQLKGACLVPKRALDVMKGEVNRLLLLTKDSVIPVPYIIPRRSYAEFLDDVFPDTYSGIPGCSVTEWLAGETPTLTLMSLNPELSGKLTSKELKPEAAHIVTSEVKTGSKTTEVEVSVVKIGQKTAEVIPHKPDSEQLTKSITVQGKSVSGAEHHSTTSAAEASHDQKLTVSPSSKQAHEKAFCEKSSQSHVAVKHTSSGDQHAATEDSSTQTTPTVASEGGAKRGPFKVAVKASKFRHLKGTALHRSQRIDNIRNLSNSVPGESDGFAINRTRCAIPLQGPAGLLAVLEIGSPGKLDDAGLPCLTHGTAVTDFVWDPFCDTRLAVSCDNGCIYLWNIPETGLAETLETPNVKIAAHTDKIYCIRYHPLAKDVLASASQDFSVKVWRLDSEESTITLEGHTNTIFSIAWSSDGTFLATLCKDGKLRIYEPRAGPKPVREGPGSAGSRGGRLLWVLSDSYIVVSAFDKSRTRVLQLHDVDNLTACIATVDLDISPAILVPHYDPDSQTIFLTARGDTVVQAFEVSGETPYFSPLSSYHANGQHQAMGFLPKICCDVKQVEFAKAYRLTSSMLEPISFTVPRVKPEFFQDDLFPDTRVTWEPTMSAADWCRGADTQPIYITLQPHGMQKLTDQAQDEVKEKKFEKFDPSTFKTDAQKRDELVSAVTAKLDFKDEPLPQDLCEGVEPDEWSD